MKFTALVLMIPDGIKYRVNRQKDSKIHITKRIMYACMFFVQIYKSLIVEKKAFDDRYNCISPLL